MNKLIKTLVAVRKAKGLSQSQLGALLNLPQSHISKIEAALIDLRLSTLIEITRIMELEIRLVPKSLLPLIDGLLIGKDISQEQAWTINQEETEDDRNS